MASSPADSSSASTTDERIPALPTCIRPLRRFADLGQFLKKYSQAVVVYVLVDDLPSRQQLDVVENFNKDFPDMGFAAASAKGDIAHVSGITAAPATIFYEHGYPIGQQLGANPAVAYEALVAWANKGAEEASRYLQTQQPKANERVVLHALERGCLKGLVSREPLMVFMKGEPSNPVCRFSKQLMQIFADNNIQRFGFVNILEDNHLREALKGFSDWPTYPQIYSEGEFIGGVDILKSLAESGQLRSSLTAACFVADEAPVPAETAVHS